jgi:hypothetical protein
MPGTLWSAPSSPGNVAPLVVSSFTTATLTDISPGQCLIPPGYLNLGTRVRITAAGSYIATTTASTITWQLNMNQAGTVIGTTPAVLTVSPAITAVAISGITWVLQYWGKITAVSATTGTAAAIVGHGTCTTGLTSLTAAMQVTPMPVTVAGMTVAQTATGLITYTEQNVMVGATVATNTGLTSITCDELTCELLG